MPGAAVRGLPAEGGAVPARSQKALTGTVTASARPAFTVAIRTARKGAAGVPVSSAARPAKPAIGYGHGVRDRRRKAGRRKASGSAIGHLPLPHARIRRPSASKAGTRAASNSMNTSSSGAKSW